MPTVEPARAEPGLGGLPWRGPEVAESEAAAPIDAVVSASRHGLLVDGPSSAEPRGRALADEPLLAPHLATVRQHFSGKSLHLRFESLALTPERTAVLLSEADEHFVLVVDRHGSEASTIAWSKDHPLVGTFGGATEVALAGGPEGEVQVAWFDPTSRVVAFRRWRSDGSIEADWALGGVDACDAITARFWPRQGFLVAASKLGTGKVFLLDLRGMVRWKGGVEVDLGHASRAPLTMVPDGDEVVVVGPGIARIGGKRGAPDHALAVRLDARGASVWPSPVDVGRATVSFFGVDARLDEGGVRVILDPGHAVLLARSGALRPLRAGGAAW